MQEVLPTSFHDEDNYELNARLLKAVPNIDYYKTLGMELETDSYWVLFCTFNTAQNFTRAIH
jgi:hypothetical protein